MSAASTTLTGNCIVPLTHTLPFPRLPKNWYITSLITQCFKVVIFLLMYARNTNDCWDVFLGHVRFCCSSNLCGYKCFFLEKSWVLSYHYIAIAFRLSQAWEQKNSLELFRISAIFQVYWIWNLIVYMFVWLCAFISAISYI